ncbi:MAG: TPM domain-containing protein [Leptolyngbya sp. SIO4C1]|nr:TPM domain-containing protein [Leptolyngbya sp. SIO4C1]
MTSRLRNLLQHRVMGCCLAVCFALFTWGLSPAAHAVNNPDLLPDEPTVVIDLGRLLTDSEETYLNEHLPEFEAETGWKLRVLTQFDETPGRAVKDFWGLDDKSVMLVADRRGGNILNFSVGDSVYELLPRVFWIELQTRFGNQFYVREHGEDQAILGAIGALETCLNRGGCAVVPGLPQEQWVLTLVTSILGGVICGFAAHPRKAGQAVAWQWVLIFSPLWAILFVAFGIGPVVTRTSDWLPLVRNIAGFIIGALVAYLTPAFGGTASNEAQ